MSGANNRRLNVQDLLNKKITKFISQVLIICTRREGGTIATIKQGLTGLKQFPLIVTDLINKISVIFLTSFIPGRNPTQDPK